MGQRIRTKKTGNVKGVAIKTSTKSNSSSKKSSSSTKKKRKKRKK